MVKIEILYEKVHSVKKFQNFQKISSTQNNHSQQSMTDEFMGFTGNNLISAVILTDAISYAMYITYFKFIYANLYISLYVVVSCKNKEYKLRHYLNL